MKYTTYFYPYAQRFTQEDNYSDFDTIDEAKKHIENTIAHRQFVRASSTRRELADPASYDCGAIENENGDRILDYINGKWVNNDYAKVQ